MKFGKKLKDLQNTKTIEPQAITGINRLVCTSKLQNVELKGISIKILSKRRCQDPRQRRPSRVLNCPSGDRIYPSGVSNCPFGGETLARRLNYLFYFS